ncbi:MAG: antibiotic biosynthesis monooxygenase family protein, partial [Nocardioides sp.]
FVTPRRSVDRVIVATRFRVDHDDAGAFRADAELAHDALARRPGYRDGWLGRNADDPGLWTLITLWDNVGSYRRALSSYEVKLNAVPLLSRSLDEPSAFELVEPGTDLNVLLARSLD